MIMSYEKQCSEDEESNFNEEENDFDSEENEDYEEQSMKKKKKRNALTNFILDEAEVDDDDEEEDAGDAESDFEQMNRDFVADDEGPSAKEIEGKRRLNIMLEDDEEKVMDYYKKKYVHTSRQEFGGQGGGMVHEVTQAALLPSSKDPSLWLLRCRMGEEKATAVKLMCKMIAYHNEGISSGINSVVVKEGLNGFLYIESHKQTNIMKLIAGVSSLSMAKYKQEMVIKAEMASVMKVVKQRDSLKVDQWVRLKRGAFKDDMARVDHVECCQRKIHLRLIPRTDYTLKRGFKRIGASEKRPRFKRNPQKLFDADAIRQLGGEISTDGDFSVFEGNRYRDGFLFKTFNISAIVTEGITPTLSELQKFECQPDVPVEVKAEVARFVMGDVVEVVEGSFSAMQGRVIKMEGTRITVRPVHPEFNTLVFEAYALKKFFKLGDHVRVLRGQHERETGSILLVAENLITVLSDISFTELQVLPKDLQLCSEVASGVDSDGRFTFGDLVQIDAQTVGVIVKMENKSFTVLDMHGKERRGMRPNELGRKKTSGMTMALDSNQRNVKAKDVVKVINGQFVGRSGEIKYIYRYFIFMHSNEHQYFVCRNKHIKLASHTDSNKGVTADNMGAMSPRLNHDNSKNQGGYRQERGDGGKWKVDKENRALIGKNVRITQGVFKNHVGLVKNTTSTTARVELHSERRVITVDISRLKPHGVVESKTTLNTCQHSRTAYTMPTPIYGSQTPQNDGSRTPYNATSRHEASMTPGRQSAWEPSISNTPARQSDFDDLAYSHDTPDSFADNTPFADTTPFANTTPFSPYHDQSTAQSPMPFDSHHDTSSTSFSPMTPGLPDMPSTALGGDMGDWVGVDMVVSIRDSYEDPDLFGLEGVVRSTTVNMCSLELLEKDRVINIATHDLEPVIPAPSDKVCVIKGKHKDLTGRLSSLKNGEGVVQQDKGGEQVFPLPHLCKVVL